ncbi:hypothetical protein N431DRAFT_458534 [Stipitochalara longipes BDJ]|nr:hypothetical protein N431DRAFT_458534 [Stipitochalara longipes BDJ]
MSAAVFGFTIITIIFTPLSFMVSLFALPIDRFQQHQVPSVWTDQAGMYSTKYMGRWIATAELISVSLTLAIMWFMVEYALHVPLSRKVWGWMKGLPKTLSKAIRSIFSDESTDTSTTAANKKSRSDEKQPDAIVTTSVDQSSIEHGNQDGKARNRKWRWHRKSEKPEEDEENGNKSKK